MVSISNSADFHARFQDLKNEILQSFESSNPTASDITTKLNALRSLYTAQSGSLPSYDQRQYDLTLLDLEKKVSVVRAKEKPRTKFAFTKQPPLPKPRVPTPTPSHMEIDQDCIPIKKEECFTQGSNADASLTTNINSRIFTLANLDQAYITQNDITAQGEYTLSISNVNNSIIDLRPGSSSNSSFSGKEEGDKGKRLMSLHAKGLRRCVVMAGQLENSALLHDITESIIVLGAHQFRMHTSNKTKGLIHVTSVPVIEHCSELRFGPYPKSMGVVMGGENQVGKMADFDWVRQGPSPNWSSLSGEEQQAEEIVLRNIMDQLGQGVDVTELLSRVLR